jgi:hypothetical protein
MEFQLRQVVFGFNEQPVTLVCRDPLGGLKNVYTTLAAMQAMIDNQHLPLTNGADVCTATISAFVAIALADLSARFPQLGTITVVPQPATAP